MTTRTEPNLALPLVNARLAATLVLVRSSELGPEVLLLRRVDKRDLFGGAWVFPGGALSADDKTAHAECAGLDNRTASTRLSVPDGGLDHVIAALRECFEECGVLLAVDSQGVEVSPSVVASLQARRSLLSRGDESIADLCRQHRLRLSADRAHYIGHWITPHGMTKRFDTRFFIAEMPHGQCALHDGSEVVEHRWIRPSEALAKGSGLSLPVPTRATLEQVAAHADVITLMAWARESHAVPLIETHLATDASGSHRVVHPSEPAWAEVRRLDPFGRQPASCVIRPGDAVRLSDRIIRVTAANANAMTGPGTNTYLVGAPDSPGSRNQWAVIDPGPDDPMHIADVLAAAPGPVRWILATHSHVDHSPGAGALAAATGAQVLGMRATHTDWQDPAFVPDRLLRGGERLAIDHQTTLRVIHTPGHASNHLCFLLEEERTLFTGDHVMQGSTVVISPPDGDMGAYLSSLRDLLRDEAQHLDWLAPGHGFLIAEPALELRRLIAHRETRENKVLAALLAAGGSRAEQLLDRVYEGLAPNLRGAAMRSLTAHLLKLRAESRARETDGRWTVASD